MLTKCLSIAGFDGSGGAGLQADLKTFTVLGCYGMTVLTALPIQNTCGVRSIYPVPINAIEEQLEAIFDDIVPDAIKVGMVFTAPIAVTLARILEPYCPRIPLVIDPVMISKNGHALISEDTVEVMIESLFPLAKVVTPNLFEAQKLTGGLFGVEELAHRILKYGSASVLIKGGHVDGSHCEDLLLTQEGERCLISSPRVNTKNLHGTGCTLSAALAAYLGRGKSLSEAFSLAKSYISRAIDSGALLSIGKGCGPVNFFGGLS